MRERIVILLICLSLAACGVKPNRLSPPEGEQTAFPRTYPAEGTGGGVVTATEESEAQEEEPEPVQKPVPTAPKPILTY